MKKISADEIRSASSIYGRSLGEKGPIALDWSCSGVRFLFKGKGDVVASFSISSNWHHTKFAVEVDGVLRGYVVPSKSSSLASFLEVGTYEIRLYKTSEGSDLTTLDSLLIEEEASISKPSPDKGLKIEFIGDSITCGNQIDVDYENTYEAYSGLLGRAYGGNFSIVAISGRGLIQGFNDLGPGYIDRDQMEEIWNKTSFYRNRTAKWVPEADMDLVIVNIGNNDLAAVLLEALHTTPEDFFRALKRFHKVLRQNYPKAKMVFAYGSNPNRNYMDEYRNCVEGLGDKDVIFIELPLSNSGDMGHPNRQEHDNLAAIISAKTAQLLEIQDPYVRRF